MGHEHDLQDIVVYRLSDFNKTHPNIHFPHRHSFYQILYIEKGSGIHIVDFHAYAIAPETAFFLMPHQVHGWQLSDDCEGYLLNFDKAFLDTFLADQNYLDRLFIYSGGKENICLKAEQMKNGTITLSHLMFKILESFRRGRLEDRDLLRVLLLQLLLVANEMQKGELSIQTPVTNFIHRFEKLIQTWFLTERQPSFYADKLNVSPNYLNTICKREKGLSAGELIRERVVLEAKRRLVNSNESVSQISSYLGFPDNSYFTKFFRKVTGATPDAFRKNQKHFIANLDYLKQD